MEPFVVLSYLEPGSGSILIQTVLAMVFSAAFFLRRWLSLLFTPIRSLFRRKTTPGHRDPA
ncbi:MAG: hypothetical protein AB7O52_17720 [Planctomycetota bacterium]